MSTGRSATRVVSAMSRAIGLCRSFLSSKEKLMVPNANQKLTVDQAKALLGPPPLMLGESEEEYWKWWAACVEPERPKKFFDWLEVNELAHNKWEQKRLRLSRAAIPK